MERGLGSLTAEQFLEVLAYYNVPVSAFAHMPTDTESLLQNALARLGARHLHEVPDAVLDERYADPAFVIQETLLSAESSRQLTALAPVLVEQIRRVNLLRLFQALRANGFGSRLGWLVENVEAAVAEYLKSVAFVQHGPRLGAAQGVLRLALEAIRSADSDRPAELRDVLLPTDQRGLRNLEAFQSSAISKNWGIVTRLQPSDFQEALEAALDSR